MRGRDHARLIAFGTVVVFALVLGSCWVNQNNIANVDKVDLGASVAVGSRTLDIPYGSDPAERLDVFRPSGRQEGTIIYFHSGGWTGGSKANIPALVFQAINRGWAIVSVDYRLAGTNGIRAPEILADVDRSIRFVKANARTLDLEVSTVVASGWSAGGLLALMAGIAPGWTVDPALPAELAVMSPQVDAVVSLAGASDLRGWSTANGIAQSSVEAFVGCPPTPPAPPPTTSTTSTTVGPTPVASPVSVDSCTPLSPDLYSPAYRAAFAAWFAIKLPPLYLANSADDPIVPLDSQAGPLYDRWAAAAGDGATYFDVPPAGGHDVSVQVNKTIFDWWLAKVAARSF
jgi:acetyl esterase/lipase